MAMRLPDIDLPATELPAPNARPWWFQPRQALLGSPRASAAGLTTAQAQARLRRFGRNVVGDRPEQSPAGQFLRRFGNPLVLILIAARSYRRSPARSRAS